MRWLLGLLVAVLVLGAVPAQAADVSALRGIEGSEQVIVVTASSWSSKTGTLRAYERADTDGGDGWREVVGATTADLGWSGLTPAAKRRQGSGKTPVGTFAITSAFGRQADPGTGLDYYRFDRDDRWTFDPRSPSTYNVLQTNGNAVKRYRSEHLWRFGQQYDYVAVMDFNLPDGDVATDARGIARVTDQRANTEQGGAIFLHVTTGKATAGCIAIPRDQMRRVLEWLDTDANPVIVVQVA